MTVAAGNNKAIYTANGSNRYWDITFPYFDAEGDDIKLYVTAPGGADTLISANYEIDVDNSRVVYPTVASGLPYVTSGYTVTVIRVEPLTQEQNLQPRAALTAANIESALDKLTMITQQLNESISRCVSYPVSQTPSSTETTEFLNTLTGYVEDAETAATAAAASASAAATSAGSASSSASTASSAASAASTSATAASASQTAAAASASAAATSASAASTSATAAASSASSASTSATSAASSASTASTAATNASASATAAASSASAASASAAAAAQSAIDAADAAAGVLANPMTTAGDIIYGLALGVPERLAKNASANTVLHSGTVPSWSAVVEADITLADNTTNNVSTSKHGFVPKAPNDATKYLDGTGAWATISAGGRILQIDVFTASGTWTKPSGCTKVVVELVAGGGGGGSGDGSGRGGSGGGGGGFSKKLVSSPGSTETVTVGAGGTGGDYFSGPSAAASGGSSSFGSHCSATGGSGGATGASGGATGGSGGAGSGGDLNLSGGRGNDTYGTTTETSGSGGGSAMGFGGGAVKSGVAGKAGTGYGAGGGGNSSTGAGGNNGTDGVVIVYSLS